MELIVELALEIYEFGRSPRFWRAGSVMALFGVSLWLSASNSSGARAAAVAVAAATLIVLAGLLVRRWRGVGWETWLALGAIAAAWPLALAGVQSGQGALVVGAIWPALGVIPWCYEVVREARHSRRLGRDTEE